MKNTYKLIWSNEAIQNLKHILEYLELNWTKREIRKFARLLDKKLNLIESNPFIFAESIHSKGLWKSVITKQTSLFYRIEHYEIRIITLFDNRQNPAKLNKK
ncbi:type II toxin-antitoxin system RelE/ParE family toxin [Maribellus sediminis]|uniref:type II toxin-antitoxin system RelE/ParE family toxin n=1 Tax=Maribellus sediminis TaxID=2696285 RepID=UPI001430B35C